MPFKSKAQQRFMFAAEARGDLKPGTAREWAHETKDIKMLPEHVGEDDKEARQAGEKKALEKVAIGLHPPPPLPATPSIRRKKTRPKLPDSVLKAPKIAGEEAALVYFGIKEAGTRQLTRMWDAVQRMPAGPHPSARVEEVRQHFNKMPGEPKDMPNYLDALARGDTRTRELGPLDMPLPSRLRLSNQSSLKKRLQHVRDIRQHPLKYPLGDSYYVDQARSQATALSGRHGLNRRPVDERTLPFQPDMVAWKGGPLPVPMDKTEAAWVSGHPEVSTRYLDNAGDRLRAYDPRDFGKQSPWHHHVGEDTRDMSNKDIKRLHVGKGPTGDGRSPYFEKVVNMRDLGTPTATYKPLPGFGRDSLLLQQVQGRRLTQEAEPRTKPLHKQTPWSMDD